MHSLATEAPPSPPNTALSVVIWMAARWGEAAPSPRMAFTLVAVICRKSFGAHHVIVEAIEALLPQRRVVHVLGVHLEEARAARLQQILGDVGGRRGDHIHVAALDEPRDQRAEPGAGQRAGQAKTDEPVAV